MAGAGKRNGVGKLIWPAGGTNLMADDEVTPACKAYANASFNAEGIYKAHQACTDAIRDVGVNYVIFCPGRMSQAGHSSPRGCLLGPRQPGRRAWPGPTRTPPG